jgi:hypothetical protein
MKQGLKRQTTVEFRIPKTMKLEHYDILSELVRATNEPGGIGEAAKATAKILHNHFVNEEAYAIPPLGLLPQLVAGDRTPGCPNRVVD